MASSSNPSARDDIELTTMNSESAALKQTELKEVNNKHLRKAIVEGNWNIVQREIVGNQTFDKIDSDGNTMLHIAVEISRNDFVRDILSSIRDKILTEKKNSCGKTALHIAAIIGNTEAARHLVRKNRNLLNIEDNENKKPSDKAYENIHIDTYKYLLKEINETSSGLGELQRRMSQKYSDTEDLAVKPLLSAISAKQYDFAKEAVKSAPEVVVRDDMVLMAIAKAFPSGLDYGETILHPIVEDIYERIIQKTRDLFRILVDCCEDIIKLGKEPPLNTLISDELVLYLLFVPLWIIVGIYHLISLLILIVYFPFFMIYFLSLKVAARVVPGIKKIEMKKRNYEDAKEVLKLVCDEVDKLETPHNFYKRPVLEAARQNAYEVVEEILMRSSKAILSQDDNDHNYDIIQLAVLNRSEKIYNLIYMIGEHKIFYRTLEDSSHNNLLHLVGRLAPEHILKRRIGAAFQLQRELQWRQEVEKLVFPTYITKKNIDLDTPDMVFTKAHKNLVIEGEKWMKTLAESCNITAALITTIMFAAAITVPGGNKTDGTPFFKGEADFIIFAIADAISLFASTTALLMFMSILTGRFAEQDFLVTLPRRLIIGLCTLMISTTAMIVAFSAILFIVACNKNKWMLAPICVSAILPIAAFGTLQIPLIVDLLRSTYMHNFGKPRSNKSFRLNLDDIRMFLGR